LILLLGFLVTAALLARFVGLLILLIILILVTHGMFLSVNTEPMGGYSIGSEAFISQATKKKNGLNLDIASKRQLQLARAGASTSTGAIALMATTDLACGGLVRNGLQLNLAHARLQSDIANVTLRPWASR
jgi:hypothetical protein